MSFVQADFWSLTLFVFFALFMSAVPVVAVWKANYRFKFFSVAFAIYLLAFSGLVVSGWPRDNVIPAYPLLFASVFVMAGAFAFSGFGRKLARVLPFAYLIGFQAFRLPLELILHHWASIGTVPETMTWSGQNLDVIAGALAFLTAPIVDRKRWLAWTVQIVGFALLLNVIRVVVMSSPLPFAWPLENPIQLAGHFPYALIGPLFVGVALATHLVAFRALLLKPSERETASKCDARLPKVLLPITVFLTLSILIFVLQPKPSASTTSAAIRLPRDASVTITEREIEPGTEKEVCGDFDIDERALREAFANFRILTAREIHDNYIWGPCSISGLIVLDRKTYYWKFRIGELLHTNFPDGVDKTLGGVASDSPSGE